MFRNKPSARVTIDCLIGVATRLEGKVVFEGGLRVDGQVRGDVVAAGTSAGMLVVGENARIVGDVEVAHLVVNGAIEGSVVVDGPVELQAKAVIRGELRYRSLEVQPGAIVEGLLTRFDGDEAGGRPGLKLAASQSGSTPQEAQALFARPTMRRVLPN